MNVGLSDLPASANSLRDQYFELMDHPNWKLITQEEESSFEASTLSLPSSEFVGVRGRALVDATVGELHEFFSYEDTFEAHTAIADEMFAGGTVVTGRNAWLWTRDDWLHGQVESIVANRFFVVHGRFKFPPLTSDRDGGFEVLVEHSQAEVEQMYCLARSRTHDAVQADSRCDKCYQ